MHSLSDFERANFHAVVLEALTRISVNDVVAQSSVADIAVEILRLEQQIKDLEQPIDLVGASEESIKTLQERNGNISWRRSNQRAELSRIFSGAWAARIFAVGLVQHLTGKEDKQGG